MMDGMMDGMQGMPGNGWWGVLVTVLVIGALLVVLVGAATAAVLARRRPGADKPDESVQELRRRLARGEIDEDDYLSRRSVLDDPR